MEKSAKKRKLEAKISRLSLEEAQKIITRNDGEWRALENNVIINAKANFIGTDEYQSIVNPHALCSFEEYVVEGRPILVGRCSSAPCRRKIKQEVKIH